MAEVTSKQHLLDQPQRIGYGLVALTLIVFVLLSLTYSLVLPLGEAADEAEHFALIRFIAEKGRPPLTLAEKNSISAKGDASPIYHTLVALLTQHVDVSDLPELPDPRHRLERAIPYDKLPFKGLYHTEDEAFPFRGIVLAWHLARLVSIPLAATIIIAAYATVLAIYPDRQYLALAAAIFVAFIPRFVINSAIVSDDNLVIPLIAFATYLLVRIVQGDERKRTFVILGALMGLAAISKYHSLLLLPVMTLVLLILARLGHSGWRLWLRRWALIMVAFILTAGWWFAFLLIQFNQVADLGWVRGLVAPLGDPVITTGIGRVLNLESGSQLGYEVELSWFEWIGLFFKTFWFRYGRGHVIDNPVVNWGLLIITALALLSLIIQTVRRWRHRHRRPLRVGWRLEIGMLGLLLLVYLSIVVIRYQMLPTRETAQGRHLYPALVAIAFFFVLNLSGVPHVTRTLLGHRFGSLENKWSTSNYDRILAIGVSVIMITFSVMTLPLFVIPVYYPFLPITTAASADAPIQHQSDVSFAEGVDFKGHTLGPSPFRAGETVPITLYWSTATAPGRDYLVKICLHDSSGQPVSCRQGHPADGRYPMRAWEVGYLIRDEVYLPTPYCLPPGDYELVLSVQPLRLDAASTTFDETIVSPDSLSLGWVALADGRATQPSDYELWVGNRPYNRGNIELKQIRQALTVIDYSSSAAPEKLAGNEPNVRLLRTDPKAGSQDVWIPVAAETTYQCPDGLLVSVSNFIVDLGIHPGAYHLARGDQNENDPVVIVQTHPRNFDPPAKVSHKLNASFAEEVELLGYNLDLSPRWPGEIIDLEIYWRALTAMGQRYVGSLHLLDADVQMWGQRDHILGNDFEYPNVLWAPGEIVKQNYMLSIGGSTRPGLYTIEFGVYNNASGDFDFLPVTVPPDKASQKQLHLGQIRVMDPARTLPPPQPVEVELDGQIQLLGFDLAPTRLTRTQPLQLTLHWQAINPPSTDLTVFTQLVGPDGLVWAQQDNMPQDGRFPTTEWTLNDRVVDRYQLSLPENAPSGEYRLLVGMYDLSTGHRSSAISNDGTQLPDNAILLATLTLK